MTLLPMGIKGLVFAALLAAIVSSLASMTNSISTIFTMDILPSFNKGDASANPVRVGRIVALAAMLIAMVAARPLLGNFDQAFQYIQEFTGFFTPGIVVIFMLGIFYAKTTATAALTAAIASAVLSFAFSVFAPELPFIDRVGLVFLLCAGLAVGISHLWPRPQAGAVELGDVSFATSSGFNLSALLVTLILCAFYITWW
jgi:SSS family solute:Na+ symporter